MAGGPGVLGSGPDPPAPICVRCLVCVPCCEWLLAHVWTSERWPSGCPWCGRTVGTYPSGKYYPHRDIDPADGLGRWGRQCRGSGRRPQAWRPDLVTVRPDPGLL